MAIQTNPKPKGTFTVLSSNRSEAYCLSQHLTPSLQNNTCSCNIAAQNVRNNRLRIANPNMQNYMLLFNSSTQRCKNTCVLQHFKSKYASNTHASSTMHFNNCKNAHVFFNMSIQKCKTAVVFSRWQTLSCQIAQHGKIQFPMSPRRAKL